MQYNDHAARAVNYLLGLKDHKNEEREINQVLRGDPRLVSEVANTVTQKNQYVSLSLNWRTDEQPTEEQIEEVLDEFIKSFCPEPVEPCYTAILHKGKGGKNPHVHIMIANCDLRTKAYYVPYSHEENLTLNRNFVNCINAKYENFVSPNDERDDIVPTKMIRAKKSYDLNGILLEKEGMPKEAPKTSIKERIINEFREVIGRNKITDFKTLVKFLNTDKTLKKYAVSRIGKDYISVYDDSLEKKVPVRLKGDIFSAKPMPRQSPKNKDIEELQKKLDYSILFQKKRLHEFVRPKKYRKSEEYQRGIEKKELLERICEKIKGKADIQAELDQLALIEQQDNAMQKLPELTKEEQNRVNTVVKRLLDKFDDTLESSIPMPSHQAISEARKLRIITQNNKQRWLHRRVINTFRQPKPVSAIIQNSTTIQQPVSAPAKKAPVIPQPQPAVSDIFTKDRDIPLGECFSMTFQYFYKGLKKEWEQAEIEASAMCLCREFSQKEIFDWWTDYLMKNTKKPDFEGIRQYVLTAISDSKARYEEYRKTPALIAETFKKIVDFQKHSIQQQPLQQPSQADESPADDLDNGMSM